MVPELYDLMSHCAKLMVTAHRPQVQKLCGQVFMKFVVDYPLSKKRRQQHLDELVCNLKYEYDSGRLSALKTFANVIDAWPAEALNEQVSACYTDAGVAGGFLGSGITPLEALVGVARSATGDPVVQTQVWATLRVEVTRAVLWIFVVAWLTRRIRPLLTVFRCFSLFLFQCQTFFLHCTLRIANEPNQVRHSPIFERFDAVTANEISQTWPTTCWYLRNFGPSITVSHCWICVGVVLTRAR